MDNIVKTARTFCKKGAVNAAVTLVIWVSCPTFALAIPSPELVIGSVSSLSQIFAVGFAFVSGLMAIVARKFGFRSSSKGKTGGVSWRVVGALALIILCLSAALLIQQQNARNEAQARMQATLVRPAQSSGTKIKDANLIETSFEKQSSSSLAMATQELDALLNGPVDERPLLYDVRETGEHNMGTLPSATHVRYPDFLSQYRALPKQKVVLFCHNGNRSSETCAELAARGIDCSFVAGGIEKWIVEGRPFSDSSITKLSDLRALPDYENKNTLLTTLEFSELMASENLQVVDARYPGDFAGNHLPGAINIPVRALPTKKLQAHIAKLEKKPTVAACYDRRSCFMSQVLGLELSQAGIEFVGRYTTPWDYFVPSPVKPHIEVWLDKQNTSFWQRAINWLANAMEQVSLELGLIGSVFLLALLSRLAVLPIALKSERDQIVSAQNSEQLAQIKKQLSGDPARKARAIQQYYTEHGLTPVRNLAALLFLPLMMLGLSATEDLAKKTSQSLLWVTSSGEPDPTFILPVVFSILGGLYLHWAIAKTPKQAVMWWCVGAPLLFLLVFQLSFLGNVYLCFALTLLLVQRAYVNGLLARVWRAARERLQTLKVKRLHPGIIPLSYSHLLKDAGNKSYRLSVMKNSGLPVPKGVVVTTEGISEYMSLSAQNREGFSQKVAALAKCSYCAVRSSAAAEDGAEQSFAGIFDSVLHVTPQSLSSALDTVIASFSSTRAASYGGTDEAGQDGNILVQEMIEADYAGVVFTQDPTAPGLMIIELAQGTGDDLVSGRVTPETHRIGRYTQKPVEDHIAPISLEPLIDLCRQIEKLFNAPQDIEWAYKDGEYFILQSRDITTLATGSVEKQIQIKEWERVFDRFGNANAEGVILEQDEMSEVLPTPTPISFSLMSRMWAPGGSLDFACRELGVPYKVNDGNSGHLFCLFGKTYVDRQMKEDMVLKVSASKAKALNKSACIASSEFQTKTLPELSEFLAPWKATDFGQLPYSALQTCLSLFTRKFVSDTYVEAEKINILAGFTMVQAQNATDGNPKEQDRLRHSDLQFSMTGLLRNCTLLPELEQKPAAMRFMGHRAIFDYEISSARYYEAPNLLWPLLKSVTGRPAVLHEPVREDDPVSLALALQDLKEQAKHESLWLIALMRKTLLAISKHTELGELIYFLKLSEIEGQSQATLNESLELAKSRKMTFDTLLKMAPKQVELTLYDCERASSSGLAVQNHSDGTISGNCVSGSEPVSGRIFVVDESAETPEAAFDGFRSNDIVVCHMINPEWIPFLRQSGGILSEVGGWLSHMSIVAREHDWLMLVACKRLDALQTGLTVTANVDGEILQSESPRQALSLVR